VTEINKVIIVLRFTYLLQVMPAIVEQTGRDIAWK